MRLFELVISYKSNRHQTFRTNQHSLSGSQILRCDDYRLEVEIEGNASWKVTLSPTSPIQIESAHLMAKIDSPTASVLTNGYQTWTESGEFSAATRLPGLNPVTGLINKRRQLASYGDYLFCEYSGKRGHFHSYSYACLRFPSQQFLLGSLIEDSGFTIFHFDTPANLIRIERDCPQIAENASRVLFNIALMTGPTQHAVFARYFDKLSASLMNTGTTTGWTSWYNYYTGINEAIILENLATFCDHDIPIDIFQIDDGYQQAVGDWLIANSKFPNGMDYIAGQIHDAGYDAGLWLAPFIAESASDLVKHHPDWLLRNDQNEPVVAGHSSLWSGRFFALDFYHEEVRDYLQTVFSTMLDTWQFDMLKLDFLYAVALHPPPHKSRGEVMREAMTFLRQLAGDKRLLGCGVPLASAFGLVDYCRVSADVGLKWEYKILSDLIRYRERVSTYAALRSTLARHQLNQRAFANDPDVFILREENVQMSPQQKHTLFVINLICGDLLFTSDNIGLYDDDTMRLYLSQFPLRPRDIIDIQDQDNLFTITFRSHGRGYLVFANLGKKERTVNIPDGNYYEAGRAITDATLTLLPYQTRILLQSAGADYEVLGSTLHLFAGMEIEEMEHLENSLRLRHSAEVRNSGLIILRVPDNLRQLIVNGETLTCKQQDGANIVEVIFN